MVSKIKRDIGRRSQFFILQLHSMTPLRGTSSEYCQNIWCEELEWLDYQEVKTFQDMFSCFHPIHIHDRQTDAMPWQRPRYA